MKNRIKEIRKNKGVTQKQLADKLNVTRQAVSAMENSNSVTTDTLEKIAAALGCSIIDLIDRDSFESASDSEKVKLSNIAFEAAQDQSNSAYDIASAAGYIWIVPKVHDHLIHLVDKKTRIEYAVEDELFTAAIDGSRDFINYNFEKLIKSAKIVNNGNETEKEI